MSTTSYKPCESPGLEIRKLGECRFESPLAAHGVRFVADDEYIAVNSHSYDIGAVEAAGAAPPMLEMAGPRQKIFFDLGQLNCGIVTCGGLCPGLNDVVRTITLALTLQYGVKTVWGFRYGYLGLSSRAPKPPMRLNPQSVDDIHLKGGDILSSSRGAQNLEEMIRTLEQMRIGLLFTIGGDGTLRGAHELADEIARRRLDIAVVGVPKTIDNDISGIEYSFGFSTAVEFARFAISAAHEEARGAWNGVGLVKLMGRDSGFIAAEATMANTDVNFCLIPEVPLVLDGPNGFLPALERRLEEKHHAVVVVAEGAGAELTEGDKPRIDASGNIIRDDIGLVLKKKITEYFRSRQKSISLKYIDPSYMIRSQRTDSNDAAFCVLLGQNAVHAGISGRTDMFIGYWNQHFVHVPTAVAIHKRKKVDPFGHLWQAVLQTTGQPKVFDSDSR